MTRKAIAWSMSTTILAFLQCSDAPITGNGGSSETVNAKVAVIDSLVSVSVEDHSSGELSLQLFSANYRPFEKTGFRDSVTGRASEPLLWHAPSAGSYNLLLRSDAAGAAGFLQGILLGQGAADTISLILKPCIDLSGSLTSSDSSAINEPYVLAIYGSPFYSLSDSTGRFIIASVPAGHYTLSVRSTAKRLFVPMSNYLIATETLDPSTRLRIMLR
ncbi:MAG: hypothetical protein JW913_16665 [Chitinispirillaceae bacterium]|nr:hypothetical protein [Chitinispirillaceae bacterium]